MHTPVQPKLCRFCYGAIAGHLEGDCKLASQMLRCSTHSMLVKGIVCTKNIKHKHMVSQHENPGLLILGGAQGVPNRLASIKTVHEQETDYLNMAVSKIEAHRPNVLLVEKTVSSYVQEYLLTREISLGVECQEGTFGENILLHWCSNCFFGQ